MLPGWKLVPCRLRPYFLIARIWGLNNFPHQLLRTRVGVLDKIWSRVTCIVSIGLSAQSMVFLIDPTTMPDIYVPLRYARREGPLKCVSLRLLSSRSFHTSSLIPWNQVPVFSRFLLPLFSFTMTILRLRTVSSMGRASYLSEIRQITREITSESSTDEISLSSVTFRYLS